MEALAVFMDWLVAFFVVAILILVQAFYVVAEFATISARRSRLSQLAEAGNRAAQIMLPIIEDVRLLDTYLAACQIGITVSNLVLGFFGQADLAIRLKPWLSGLGGLSEVVAESVATTLVLILFTSLQVVLGELVPKNVGIQFPEHLAMLTARPMTWSLALLRPLIWFFNGSGQLCLRLLGLSAADAHTHIHAPEEILLLVRESGAGGLLEREERRLLENTLRLRNLSVRRAMIPRIRMLVASVDEPCGELLALLAGSTFSRLPLYKDSVDNIVGLVHLKDLLCLSRSGGESHSVREVMREVPYVVETATIEEVFVQLQKQQDHVAIVLDEFGGTAGMVTLEDLLEEIFGELQDEFDAESPPIQVTPGNRLILRGDALVDEINYWLGLHLPDDEADTIGGLMLTALGRVPEVGAEIRIGDLIFRVEEMDGNSVTSVSTIVSPELIERVRGTAL